MTAINKYSIRTKAGWLRLINPVFLLSNLWQHRDLLSQMIQREIGQRYRGSYLGVGWSMIIPLVMLAIYTFVFSGIFQSRWRPEASENTSEFALTLFAGLSAFTLFAEVVSRSPTLVLSYPNFVKKVVFPLEILSVVQLGSALVNCLISQALLVIAAIVLLGTWSPTIWMLPLAYLPLVALTMGLSWLLASLGVYVRDIGQGISVVTQIALFVSPVMYPLTVVPEEYRVLFFFNPLTTILDGFRRVLLWGQPLDWPAWAAWTMGLVGLACLGHAWFMKTKAGFADVL